MGDLKRIEDLLTPEEQAELTADLAKMAKQRRDAEAFAATFVMGATGSPDPATPLGTREHPAQPAHGPGNPPGHKGAQ